MAGDEDEAANKSNQSHKTPLTQNTNAKRKSSPLHSNYTAKRSQLDALYTSTMSKPPTTQPLAGVSTNNRYEILSNTPNTEGAPATPVHMNAKRANTKAHIPPIVLLDMKLHTIHSTMQSLKVEKTKYFVKFMSIGTKLTLTNIVDYKKTRDYLTATKKHFFTHDIPEDKTQKFVLSGLYDMDTDTVKQQLIDADVHCIEVKRMKTKNANSCLFLVYFADKAINLDTLKQTRAIGNVIVKWARYITTKNGPTQCNKCQIYGHGSKNCNLPPRCLFCGGKHSKNDCIHADGNDFTPRCCLCNGNHNANAAECPSRLNYMQMRSSTSTATKRHQLITKQPANSVTRQQNPAFTNASFPPIKQTQERAQNAWTSLFQPPTAAAASGPISRPATTATLPSMPQSLLSGAQTPAPHPSNSELFTMDELLQISSELITNLAKCTNKIEQFQVISQLVIKFVYAAPNGP